MYIRFVLSPFTSNPAYMFTCGINIKKLKLLMYILQVENGYTYHHLYTKILTSTERIKRKEKII